MKKSILIFALAAFGLATQAQENGGIQFGLKAGANFATWSGDTEGLDLEMRVAINGGAMVLIPVGDMFGVQAEVLYSGEGPKIPDAGHYSLGYIRVPIMLKYLNPSGFYGEIGPNIGFLMSAKAKPDEGEDSDVKDLFKSTDFGVSIGLGYKMANGFGFGARYNLGLSNIVEEDGAELKNNVINVGIFYFLGGGK